VLTDSHPYIRHCFLLLFLASVIFPCILACIADRQSSRVSSLLAIHPCRNRCLCVSSFFFFLYLILYIECYDVKKLSEEKISFKCYEMLRNCQRATQFFSSFQVQMLLCYRIFSLSRSWKLMLRNTDIEAKIMLRNSHYPHADDPFKTAPVSHSETANICYQLG